MTLKDYSQMALVSVALTVFLIAGTLIFIAAVGLEGKTLPHFDNNLIIRKVCEFVYPLPILFAGGVLAAHNSLWWLAASVPLTVLGCAMARRAYRHGQEPEKKRDEQ